MCVFYILIDNRNSQYPVILDIRSQDYLIFQLMLEQTIGVVIARKQPLTPVGGLMESNVYKKSSSGLKNMLLLPTKHTYQLYGYVLYEYSPIPKKSMSQVVEMAQANTANSNTNTAAEMDQEGQEGDEYISGIVHNLFTRHASTSLGKQEKDIVTMQDGHDATLTGLFLQHVYPLVDLVLSGPYQEGKSKLTRFRIILISYYSFNEN